MCVLMCTVCDVCVYVMCESVCVCVFLCVFLCVLCVMYVCM